MSALSLIPESSFLNFNREIIQAEIHELLARRPTVFRNELRLELFDEFGSGGNWRSLREHVRGLVREARRSQSTTLSQWAVFSGPHGISHFEFENRLWNELSLLTSEEERHESWRGGSANHASNDLKLYIEGVPLLVTGYHPDHVVRHRRFPWPALSFVVSELADHENR